jgi:transposase
MRKYFVGLDVHWKHTTVCILDARGKKVKRMTIRGPWSAVVEKLRELRGKLFVCYEASCGYGHLYDRLSEIACRVVSAHPGQLRLIFRSKRKNDRVDAEKLAKLLFLNEVPAVYVPSRKVRAWRQLIEYRVRLVNKRTRAKNSSRALLRSLGICAPEGFGLWTRKGLQWLRTLPLPDSLHGLRRDMLVEEIEVFNHQITRAETMLKRFSQDNPAVVLLMTIPGVGLRTAETIVAYIDDPNRFHSSKSIGAYLGLVPCQDQSGNFNRLGRITREGPASARRMLCEASWQAIRRSPTVRRYFERIAQGSQERKKIAIVATAHYLARVMLAMLRTGECWREKERNESRRGRSVWRGAFSEQRERGLLRKGIEAKRPRFPAEATAFPFVRSGCSPAEPDYDTV